jgi:hypothetical protein
MITYTFDASNLSQYYQSKSKYSDPQETQGPGKNKHREEREKQQFVVQVKPILTSLSGERRKGKKSNKSKSSIMPCKKEIQAFSYVALQSASR